LINEASTLRHGQGNSEGYLFEKSGAKNIGGKISNMVLLTKYGGKILPKRPHLDELKEGQENVEAGGSLTPGGEDGEHAEGN